MECPICGSKMEQGGLVANGISVFWFSAEKFESRSLKYFGVQAGGKTIGHSNIILSQTKIPNAFYCEKCNKVVGVFDVTL